jgi:predicted nucleic-acid-binding protein
MKALDTNILARFFVDDPDDPQSAKQRPAAASALSESAFVSVTVLLEFEWVLRGFYSLPRRTIVEVLRALVGIEHLTIEDRNAALAAIDALESGMDFADALHIARSSNTSGFVTFDRRLARRARSLQFGIPIEVLA